MSEVRMKSVGVVGARGHTGSRLLSLIASHPGFELAFASSRAHAGKDLAEFCPNLSDGQFVAFSPVEVSKSGCDAAILALPDGAAAPFVEAIDQHAPDMVVIDLSVDNRFEKGWAYGLPELFRVREGIDAAKRIANPGCYATAIQILLHPVLPKLDETPSCFGVSGYSGAGTKPSPRNDQERLRDNLMPYALTGHKHEREVSHHLHRPVHFTPHVHPAFSGILVTAHLTFNEEMTGESFYSLYERAYENEPLISLQPDAPELRDGTGRMGVLVGGFSVSADGKHGVVVAAEDNLLKGAAVQAIQNLNLALGFDELTGISVV